jgi:catechol 2,3-dioxygenase-like lactoylglutathione lyase family enzyme
MISSAKAFSSFAVDDLTAARQFYGETLGLRVSDELGPLWLQIDDSRGVLVYTKPDHTPATFTVLNFPVDDIDDG